MKARITCIQNLIIKLARTHKKLYTMLYWFSMLALWVLLAFLDLSIKAVTYPVIYKMEKTSGVVSNWTENEIMVIVKGIPRASSRYTYIIDGVEVPVNVSDLEKYDVGDVMPYYRYEGFGNVVGDVYEYTLLKGVFVLLMNIFVLVGSLLILFTETNPKVLAKMAKIQSVKVNEKVDYHSMSPTELYALCVERNVPKSKLKKRNAAYLIHCLKETDKRQVGRYEDAQEKLRWDNKIFKIALVGFLIIMSQYGVALRGILSLFM
ncbi:MAG: hypothetical protein IIV45_17615 [Lachnospiraceae bacterium]|nr:hypothetical protein [Lachnospiraceae bacterium]